MTNSASTETFAYPGGELALFEKAVNWKRYWRGRIRPYVKGGVLEVGAGIGANTRLLSDLPHNSWTCLEPDPSLARQISVSLNQKIQVGTLEDVGGLFDTIVYIDVLEHIDDHETELSRAAAHLNPGGHLIVLSPAHSFLFTPFDAAIGHFRRYSRRSLVEAAKSTAALRPVKIEYLDSVGMLASLANRLLLNQSMPTERQILIWDRLMVPLSRALDPLTGRSLGKTILGIWRRE